MVDMLRKSFILWTTLITQANALEGFEVRSVELIKSQIELKGLYLAINIEYGGCREKPRLPKLLISENKIEALYSLEKISIGTICPAVAYPLQHTLLLPHYMEDKSVVEIRATEGGDKSVVLFNRRLSPEKILTKPIKKEKLERIKTDAAYLDYRYASDNLEVLVSFDCPEIGPDCDRVTYFGKNIKTGAAMRLRGKVDSDCSDEELSKCYMTWVFKNGDYTYKITPQFSSLVVMFKDKTISEKRLEPVE